MKLKSQNIWQYYLTMKNMLCSFSLIQYPVITFSFWKNTLKQHSTGTNLFQLNTLYSNRGLQEEQLFKGYYTHSIFPRLTQLIYLHSTKSYSDILSK